MTLLTWSTLAKDRKEITFSYCSWQVLQHKVLVTHFHVHVQAKKKPVPSHISVWKAHVGAESAVLQCCSSWPNHVHEFMASLDYTYSSQT